jgi:hypothetical protein
MGLSKFPNSSPLELVEIKEELNGSFAFLLGFCTLEDKLDVFRVDPEPACMGERILSLIE